MFSNRFIKLNKAQGFTLIELIVVMVILGILAATAIPRFTDLGSAARTSALQGVKSAVDSSNVNLRAASFSGAFSINNCSNSSPPERVKEIYLSGSAPSPGTCNLSATRSNPDVALMIWGWLDNDDLTNTVLISDQLLETTLSGAPWADTYVGYDLDESGDVRNDNCYYHYQQPLNEGDFPISEVISSGC